MNLTPPPHPIVTDTVMINDRMLHLGQIASTIDVPMETLQRLNPAYKLDIIPAKGASYALVLPMGDVTRFIENEQGIYAKDTLYLKQYLTMPEEKLVKQMQEPTYTVHVVKSGQTLGGIALKYRTTVTNIKKWNNLKSNMIRPKQRLKIYNR